MQMAPARTALRENKDMKILNGIVSLTCDKTKEINSHISIRNIFILQDYILMLEK